MFLNFCKIPNEAILYDLYPYIWDLKEVVLALDSYVHWLSDSITANLSLENVQRNHGPEFPLTMIPAISDYTEPWHINYLGGLTVALHRLLPFKGGYLFLDQAPDKPSNNIIKIRPYSVADKVSPNRISFPLVLYFFYLFFFIFFFYFFYFLSCCSKDRVGILS